MEQLLIHLWGDYITQSDWMASNKTSKSFPCLVHCFFYGLPFFLLTNSWVAIAVVISTHFLIDRFRLAKYVVYAKNFLAPLLAINQKTKLPRESMKQVNVEYIGKYTWENCKTTGYPSETPPFLTVWLMIIADNTLHLTINYLALKYL